MHHSRARSLGALWTGLANVAGKRRSNLARAVVPPPRLRAFPLAFDAGDSGGRAAIGGGSPTSVVLAAVTRIDAAWGRFFAVAGQPVSDSTQEKVIKVTVIRRAGASL